MWKSIKKFFKWIADHTGISWIARKISSGWKWLFSSKANTDPKNTSPKRPLDENVNKSPTVSTPDQSIQNETEESVSNTDINVEPAEDFPEKSEQPRMHANPNKPKEVGELKCVGKELLFVPTSDQFAKCKDYRNTQSANPDELLMFIKWGANEYRIAGNINEGSILIKSILRKSKGDKYIDGNILRVEEEILFVRKMLGLENSVTEVKVDNISNQPFGVKTPTTMAQQMVNNTTIDQLTSLAVTRESSTINIFNGNLELRLADDIQQNLEDYKHPKKEGKYRIKIHCNKNDFNINFSKRDNDDGSVSLIINMLQKDKRELCQVAQMKKSLGFKKGSTFVVIDSIESFKAPTNNGVPSSETTSLEAKNANCNKSLLVNAHKEKDEHNTDASNKIIQQEVDNEDNEQEEFYNAAEELDDDLHDAEEVETKTLSIVPIKKSQDNSIVINGVIIPEGAKLKFFPELSNFLSRASSEREKLFCKVVPSSLFIQSKTAEQIAGNDRSC